MACPVDDFVKTFLYTLSAAAVAASKSKETTTPVQASNAPVHPPATPVHRDREQPNPSDNIIADRDSDDDETFSVTPLSKKQRSVLSILEEGESEPLLTDEREREIEELDGEGDDDDEEDEEEDVQEIPPPRQDTTTEYHSFRIPGDNGETAAWINTQRGEFYFFDDDEQKSYKNKLTIYF